MANIDLQGLINEVLSMAKSRQAQDISGEETARYDRRQMAWDKKNTDIETSVRTHGQEMEKQRLLSTTSLGVQGLKNTGDIDTQRLKNVGDVDVQGLKNIGESARQRLTNIGLTDVANIGLTGDRYKADRLVEAYQGKTNDPEKIVNELIKSGIITDPTQILEMRRKLRAQNSSVAPTPDDMIRFNTTSPSTAAPSTPGRGSSWLTKAPGYVEPTTPILPAPGTSPISGRGTLTDSVSKYDWRPNLKTPTETPVGEGDYFTNWNRRQPKAFNFSSGPLM